MATATPDVVIKLPIPKAANTPHQPKQTLVDILHNAISDPTPLDDPFRLFEDEKDAQDVATLRTQLVRMMARPYGQDQYMTLLGAPPSYRSNSSSKPSLPAAPSLSAIPPIETQSMSSPVAAASTSASDMIDKRDRARTTSQPETSILDIVPESLTRVKEDESKINAFRNSLVKKKVNKESLAAKETVSRWKDALQHVTSTSTLLLPPQPFDIDQFRSDLKTQSDSDNNTEMDDNDFDIAPTPTFETRKTEESIYPHSDSDSRSPRKLIIRFPIRIPLPALQSVPTKAEKSESIEPVTEHTSELLSKNKKKNVKDSKPSRSETISTPPSASSSAPSSASASSSVVSKKKVEKYETTLKTAKAKTSPLSLPNPELSPNANKEQLKVLNMLAEEEKLDNDMPSYRKRSSELMETNHHTDESVKAPKKSRTSSDEKEQSKSTKGSPISAPNDSNNTTHKFDDDKHTKERRYSRQASLSMSAVSDSFFSYRDDKKDGDRGRDANRRDRSPSIRSTRRSASPPTKRDRERSRSRSRRDDDSSYRSGRRKERSRSRDRMARDRDRRREERSPGKDRRQESDRRRSDDRDRDPRRTGLDRYIPPPPSGAKDSPAPNRTPDASNLTPAGSATSKKASPTTTDASFTPILSKNKSSITEKKSNLSNGSPDSSHSDSYKVDWIAKGRQFKSEAESCNDQIRRTILYAAALFCFMSNNANWTPGDPTKEEYEDRLMKYHPTTRELSKYLADRCLNKHQDFQGIASLLSYLDGLFLFQINKNVKKVLQEKSKLLKNLELLSKEADEDQALFEKNKTKIKGQINEFRNGIYDRMTRMQERFEEAERICPSTDEFRMKYSFPSIGAPLPAVMSMARKALTGFAHSVGVKDISF